MAKPHSGRAIIVKKLAPAVTATAVLCSFLSFCVRNNPYDPRAGNYEPGTPPWLTVPDDTTAYVNVPADIPVTFGDLKSIGGRNTARVTMLYFGDSSRKKVDSLPCRPDSDERNRRTLYRIKFDKRYDDSAYFWAKDNDGQFARTAMKLHVIEEKPDCKFEAPRSPLFKGQFGNLSDTATGTITAYTWAIGDSLITDTASSCRVLFPNPGTYRIRTWVTNIDGLSSDTLTDSVVVICNIPFLVESVDWKGTGTTVNDSVMRFFFRVRDSLSRIDTVTFALLDAVNPQQSPGDGSIDSPLWQSKPFTLAPGKNTLIVTARNECGGVRVDTSFITLIKSNTAPDTAPVISHVVMPDIANSPCRVVVYVKDIRGIACVIIGSDTLKRDRDDQEVYSGDIDLPEGKDSLTVVAINSTGHSSRYTRSFAREKPQNGDADGPTVQIIRPVRGAHISDSTDTVIVDARDASRVVSVTVNGRTAVYGNPYWTCTVHLLHGPDTIRVVALDSSANRNQTADSVIVFQNRPPRFGCREKDTSVPVGGAVSIILGATDPERDPVIYSLSAAGISSARLDTNSDGTASVALTAPDVPGFHVFNVLAADSYGDGDTVTIRLFTVPSHLNKPIFTIDINQIARFALVNAPYAVQVRAIDPTKKILKFSIIEPADATIDSTGLIRWKPKPADVGKKTFTIIADNGSDSAVLSWSTIVDFPDLAPQLARPADTTINEKQTLQISLSARDLNGDSVNYTFGSSFPPNARIDGNRFTWTPTGTDAGLYRTVFKATEVGRTSPLADSTAMQITVLDNTKPAFKKRFLPDTAVIGTTLTDTLSASDDDGDSLVFAKLEGPDALAISKQGVVSWRPGLADSSRQFSIMATVFDNASPRPNGDTLQLHVFVPPVIYTWASDAAWTEVYNGYGPVENDLSNGEGAVHDGKAITLNGVTYGKGFGCHAVSEIRIALNKAFSCFTSDIGIDDEVGSAGWVVFQVLVDSVNKYTSPIMTGSSATQTVRVDVTGATTLALKVIGQGARNHADWAGARLTPYFP